MVPGDIEAIEAVLIRNEHILGRTSTVTVLSPGDDEEKLLTRLFGGYHPLSIEQWRLPDPPARSLDGDLLVVSNTFLAALEPVEWLREIAKHTRFLLIQDMAVARRGTNRFCDPESGDVSRYSLSKHGIIGQTDPGLRVFDLDESGYEVVDVERYPGDKEGVKFAALLRMRTDPTA